MYELYIETNKCGHFFQHWHRTDFRFLKTSGQAAWFSGSDLDFLLQQHHQLLAASSDRSPSSSRFDTCCKACSNRNDMKLQDTLPEGEEHADWSGQPWLRRKTWGQTANAASADLLLAPPVNSRKLAKCSKVTKGTMAQAMGLGNFKISIVFGLRLLIFSDFL